MNASAPHIVHQADSKRSGTRGMRKRIDFSPEGALPENLGGSPQHTGSFHELPAHKKFKDQNQSFPEAVHIPADVGAPLQSVLSESRLSSPPGPCEPTAALKEEKRSHARTFPTEGHTSQPFFFSWQHQYNTVFACPATPPEHTKYCLWRCRSLTRCGFSSLEVSSLHYGPTPSGRGIHNHENGKVTRVQATEEVLSQSGDASQASRMRRSAPLEPKESPQPKVPNPSTA